MKSVMLVALSLPGGLAVMACSVEPRRRDRFEAPSLEETLRGETMTEPPALEDQELLINGFAEVEWDMALKIFEREFEATPEAMRDRILPEPKSRARPEGYPDTPRKIVQAVRDRSEIGASYVMVLVMRLAMGG